MTSGPEIAAALAAGDALPMQCKACKHEWREPLALPMDLLLFSKRIKRVHCPKCDVGSKNLQISFARKS